MGDMQGREIELDATNIAHGGISVARLDGRVVFVSDAIPGERVLARVTDDDKPSFWRAETVRVLEPSIHRRPHPWAEAAVDRDPAQRAGGAEFGHIALDHQRQLKQQVLREALERFGKVERDTVVEGLPGNDDGTGWRTRVRLHVGDDGVVGPFAARSHTVIPVTDLPLAVDELREIAPLGERFDPAYEHVDLLAPALGGARLIVGTQSRSVVREVVGQREFRVDDSGFWQVHRHAAETLSTAVAGAIDDQLFDPKAANLDLYGGVGLLAAAVGDRFGPATRITSVESDARATEHAAENLADWIGAATATARVEHWVRSLSDASAAERARLSAATVVLDPPRAGAGRAVVDALAAVGPAQLVYVACDPVAFARDVGLLAGHGYRLDSLRAFDLFPMTHHVEAVGLLVREGPAR
jgi:tRNA/tmRNA/rRNA uracil-C5-methylase (TrmA/RlmC/RlmD family)